LLGNEDGDNKIPQNTGNHPPTKTTSYSTVLESSNSKTLAYRSCLLTVKHNTLSNS